MLLYSTLCFHSVWKIGAVQISSFLLLFFLFLFLVSGCWSQSLVLQKEKNPDPKCHRSGHGECVTAAEIFCLNSNKTLQKLDQCWELVSWLKSVTPLLLFPTWKATRLCTKFTLTQLNKHTHTQPQIWSDSVTPLQIFFLFSFSAWP